ncbi:MAG TPA: hypothetical protein VGE52_02580 [Pirellulales bacterium]
MPPAPEPPAASNRSFEDVVQDPPQGHRDWWSDDRVAYLCDQMFDRHRAWVEQRRSGERHHYATAFRRVRLHPDGGKRSIAELRTDGIAGCLRTPKGGSGRQILVRVGRGCVDARLVSPRECASLMGVDGYRVETTVNKALLGLGDAVCGDAVTWIARNNLVPLLECRPPSPTRRGRTARRMAKSKPSRG